MKLVTTRSTGYDHIHVAECTVSALRCATFRASTAHFQYETLRATDLRGKTPGVIGTGRVGLRVIHMALAFGMQVLAHDPYSRFADGKTARGRYIELDDLLSSAEVITLHAPLTPERIAKQN